MASLSPEQRAKGVIASSAGNHAQGVALAAKTLVGSNWSALHQLFHLSPEVVKLCMLEKEAGSIFEISVSLSCYFSIRWQAIHYKA